MWSQIQENADKSRSNSNSENGGRGEANQDQEGKEQVENGRRSNWKTNENLKKNEKEIGWRIWTQENLEEEEEEEIEALLSMDPLGCARLLVCELSSLPPTHLNSTHHAVLSYVRWVCVLQLSVTNSDLLFLLSLLSLFPLCRIFPLIAAMHCSLFLLPLCPLPFPLPCWSFRRLFFLFL